jgi:uncharacterized protein DUF4365
MLLTENNIKAELSYAYLHAVASRSGCGAVVTNRHRDSAGVDAIISAKERFAPDLLYTDFSIDVQLKATSDDPALDDLGRFPYSLRLDHYNKLRDSERQSALVLIVLFLPAESGLWLVHSADGLLARRCAYWVGLRGAPESANKATQTVYLPSANQFSVEGLRSLMTRVSRGDLINDEL